MINCDELDEKKVWLKLISAPDEGSQTTGLYSEH